MLLPDHPSTFECIVVAGFAIPLIGRGLLAFLRDLDDYREDRAARRRNGRAGGRG